MKVLFDKLYELNKDTTLPLIYLLDSIIKNVRDVYVDEVEAHIFQLFTTVYRKTQSNTTRFNMLKCLRSWPGLIDATIIEQIENVVMRIPLQARSNRVVYVNPHYFKKQGKVEQVSTRNEPRPTHQLPVQPPQPPMSNGAHPYPPNMPMTSLPPDPRFENLPPDPRLSNTFGYQPQQSYMPQSNYPPQPYNMPYAAQNYMNPYGANPYQSQVPMGSNLNYTPYHAPPSHVPQQPKQSRTTKEEVHFEVADPIVEALLARCKSRFSCLTCNLSFAEHAELTAHESYCHLQQDPSDNYSRTWFQPNDLWIVSDPFHPVISHKTINTSIAADVAIGQAINRIPVDPSQDICAICGGEFQTIQDEHTQVYMYDNVLRDRHNDIVHADCYASQRRRREITADLNPKPAQVPRLL